MPLHKPDDDQFWEKEPHFFDCPYRYSLGRTWRLQHFPECNQIIREVFIDGSPDYMPTPLAPSRIVDFYGDSSSRIKFVVLLRDPLRRMHSAFYNGMADLWWGERASSLTFQEYVTDLLEGSVDPLGE